MTVYALMALREAAKVERLLAACFAKVVLESAAKRSKRLHEQRQSRARRKVAV